MSGHSYNDKFFDYISIGSQQSAEIVVGLLLKHLSIQTVLDVGCGRGAWLKMWRKKGVANVLGIDGNYVDSSRLDIPGHLFYSADLSKPLSLGKKFDLVQSLEVAEHIAAEASSTFVKNLVSHGDLVLFSAAPPGQGGEFHINEQTYSYWRDKFLECGYLLVDFVRPQLVDNSSVEPWYRYNSLLFVKAEKAPDLPSSLRRCLVESDAPVVDYAPLTWRFRRFILRNLPQFFVSWLAAFKHWAILTIRRFKS